MIFVLNVIKKLLMEKSMNTVMPRFLILIVVILATVLW